MKNLDILLFSEYFLKKAYQSRDYAMRNDSDLANYEQARQWADSGRALPSHFRGSELERVYRQMREDKWRAERQDIDSMIVNDAPMGLDSQGKVDAARRRLELAQAQYQAPPRLQAPADGTVVSHPITSRYRTVFDPVTRQMVPQAISNQVQAPSAPQSVTPITPAPAPAPTINLPPPPSKPVVTQPAAQPATQLPPAFPAPAPAPSPALSGPVNPAPMDVTMQPQQQQFSSGFTGSAKPSVAPYNPFQAASAQLNQNPADPVNDQIGVGPSVALQRPPALAQLNQNPTDPVNDQIGMGPSVSLQRPTGNMHPAFPAPAPAPSPALSGPVNPRPTDATQDITGNYRTVFDPTTKQMVRQNLPPKTDYSATSKPNIDSASMGITSVAPGPKPSSRYTSPKTVAQR
jgi:hypothetical protein